MSDKTSVAVLGTGIMGAAMAGNLARAGHDVRVWNRTRAKAEPLAADGARVSGTPAEAVDGADVVLTMLYDGPAVLEVMRDAAPGLREGAVWAQCTTVGVEPLTDLAAFAAEHGLVFIDSPVLGTRQPAESGRLTVLAAGPEEARATLAPVFAAVGSRTTWVGDDGAAGAATRLKLVANSWVLAVTHGVAEALALAKGLDVDPQSFLDAIAGGPLDLGYLKAKSAAIRAGDFTPSFGVRLDVVAAGAERFRRAVEKGHGDEDMAASYFASFDD
jgi:3-hydroxyisobutyrate dehydrogenase